MIILGSSELSTSRVKSLSCSSALIIFSICEFGKLLGLLLSLVEIVIDALDLCIIILAFSFFESNGVSKSVDLILISSLFFSVLSELILKVISILSQSISLVTFDSNFSLEGDTFLLSSADLVPDGSYLSLVFVIGSVLLIKKESEILDFFPEGVDGDNVLVMSVVVVIVLHQFFILNMSIFLLNGV